MLTDVVGIKCFILDDETIQIVSLIYAQTEILRKDVFLVENINSNVKDQLKHINAIYLVRFNSENCDKILQELKNPRFKQYYFNFTNEIGKLFIEKMADTDE